MMMMPKTKPTATVLAACITMIMMMMAVATSATPVKANARAQKLDTMPSSTLSNGAVNPFYPCGATQSSIDACPYRCWDNSIPGLPVLIDRCYDANDASQAISNSSTICVACKMPQSYEIPVNAADNNTCQPVAAYLNSTSGMAPSRCGTPQKPISECDWSCAEEQVPFALCAATNKTSSTESCVACTKMCSSPVLVFDPPQTPQNFSLSSGNCSSTASANAACPYRCIDDGNQDNAYCSFHDRSTDNPYITCKAC